MTTVANLSVIVGAEITNFTRNMDAVQNRITSFGQTLGTGLIGVGGTITGLGDKLGNIGGKISSAIQPLNDLALSGLQAASGFEDIMTQLETFGGLAGAELDAVKKAALDMGAKTKFSANDAAKSMLEFVKAGYSAKDSMVAANASLTLAAVGALDLDSAAGIVSSTISQFNLDVDDAAMVVDVLAAGANASRADVGGLSDALANVGVIAGTMGFSLEETTAALAVMSNAGISGAEAGTQLKSALLNLTTSDTAKQQLDKLGVSLYDGTGKMRDMDSILDDLAKSLVNLTPEQQTQAMKELGGAYGITALSSLLAAGGTDAMVAAMNDAPGASDLAQKSMGTFSGIVDSLKGSVETLMIQGLTPLMQKVLTPLMSKVTDVVNSMTKWAEENPELASTIGGLVLGIGALGGILAIAAPIVSGIGLAIGAFGGAIAAVFSPLGLLVIAGVGLVALLNNPAIQDGLKAWQGVFDNLKIILGAIAADISMRLDDVAVGLRSFVRDIMMTINDLQSKAAALQIALGINVEANSQVVTDTTTAIQAADIAKKLEADLNASMAAGGAIKVDAPVLINVDQMGATADLAKQIADPALIQQAIDTAMANGDTETLKALLPLSLELASDPALQMQTLLTEALTLGGPNGQAAFEALIPMATELDIDVDGVVQQYDDKLKAAAAAKVFDVTVTANVKVNTNVDMAGFGNAAQQAGQQAAGTTGNNVPQMAVGGDIASEGLAWLHSGERVLTAAQTSAMDNGGLGGGNTYVINAYGSAPYDLANMVSKASREMDR